MIRTADLIGASARALRANPLRSALTALGVIIGVASVVSMVALGNGTQVSIQQQISSLGSNLIIVVPGAMRGGGGVRGAAGGWNSLTLGDADAIQSEVQDVAAVAPSVRSSQQVVAGSLNWNTQIQGVTPAYLIVRDWTLQSGRMFEDNEERQARKVAVLGKTVSDQLFPNMNPVDQTIRIHGGQYTVIGVLASKGQSGMGNDQDDIILAPLTTVKRTIAGRNGRADTVNTISVK
ncbi:MAG: ABC transporter permease, partial [Pseudomonadota bacterium]